MKHKKRSRTQVKDLPRPEKELTIEERQKIRGGLLVHEPPEQSDDPANRPAPYQPGSTMSPLQPAQTPADAGLHPHLPETGPGQVPQRSR